MIVGGCGWMWVDVEWQWVTVGDDKWLWVGTCGGEQGELVLWNGCDELYGHLFLLPFSCENCLIAWLTMKAKRNHITNYMWSRVIALWKSKLSFKQIAHTLNIPLSTCSWVYQMSKQVRPNPKNVVESRFLCLHAMVHLLPKCWTRTAHWPWSNLWICANESSEKPSVIQQSAVQSRHSILPQEDWPQNREKWKSPSNPWKGSVCSKLPQKVQWWPSIILLHGWGGILCFNAARIWLFTSKQASNRDGSHNQKPKHQYNHTDWDAKRWATRKNNGHQGSAMSRQHWTVSSVHGGSTQ